MSKFFYKIVYGVLSLILYVGCVRAQNQSTDVGIDEYHPNAWWIAIPQDQIKA